MTEVNTFSALVDDAIRRSGRPDRQADIVSFARQSMRECQVGQQIHFSRDLTEDQLTANASPFIWTVPREFRLLRSVKFELYDNLGNAIYPPEIKPSRKQNEFDYFYYRGLDYFVFSGLSTGVKVDVAYYSYFKKLPYYAIDARPAMFSLETDAWSYLTATTDGDKETARNQVSNWMLFDWYDLILEGTLAKVYKTCSDPRAVSSFALFKSLQKDLSAGEATDSMQQ